MDEDIKTRKGVSIGNFHVMSKENAKAEDPVWKFISHPTRRRLIQLIIEYNESSDDLNWLCVEDTAKVLGLSNTSHILKSLREFGIVVPHRDGKARYYRINRNKWEEIKSRYSEFFRLIRGQ